MIYGKNAELRCVNREDAKFELYLDGRLVSVGMRYWQFTKSLVSVMRKKDLTYDVFYFSNRSLKSELLAGPCDVFAIKIVDTRFFYQISDGWFLLNRYENNKPSCFSGDYYLGKTLSANGVFTERLESGEWNISACNEKDNQFETRKYLSFIEGEKKGMAIAQGYDGLYDVFYYGVRFNDLATEDSRFKFRAEGRALLLVYCFGGKKWKVVYDGPDCLSKQIAAFAVLNYDEGSDEFGTLSLFKNDGSCCDVHGSIVMFDNEKIAVDHHLFDFGDDNKDVIESSISD